MIAAAQARTAAVLHRAHPATLVIGATTLAQGSLVATIPLYASLGPVGTGALRLEFAALIMLALWPPRFADWHGRAWLGAVMFGVSVTALSLGTTEALDRMPVATVVPIQMLGPFGVAVISHRGRRDVLWVLLATVGVLMLVGADGAGANPAGVAYALLSALGWAAYIVSAKRLGRFLPSGGSGVAVSTAIAALLLAVPGWSQAGDAMLDPGNLAAAFALSITGVVLVFRLETEALRRMSTTTFGITMALEPAIAALWGLALLSQYLGVSQFVGMLAIGVAAAGATIGAGRESAPDPPAGPAPP